MKNEDLGGLTRRQFLKLGGVVVAGGIVAGFNPAYALGLNSLDGKIDTTTYWTPDKLKQVINDEKVTFIYWKVEGAEHTPRGNQFFNDVLRDYGSRFDRILVIEGLKHGQENFIALQDLLNEFNPSEKESSHRVPIYSIAGFGREVRIRSPPGEPYEQNYKTIYKGGIAKYLVEFELKNRKIFRQ